MIQLLWTVDRLTTDRLQISVNMPSFVVNLRTVCIQLRQVTVGTFGEGDILYARKCFFRLCTYCVMCIMLHIFRIPPSPVRS